MIPEPNPQEFGSFFYRENSPVSTACTTQRVSYVPVPVQVDSVRIRSSGEGVTPVPTAAAAT